MKSQENELSMYYQAIDYRETVLNAVNLSIDTDIIAAIAGSRTGVLYSAEGIPKEWVEKTLKVKMITVLREEFGRGIKE